MLGRATNKKFGAIQVDEVISHVLHVVGEGVKVGCETRVPEIICKPRG